jgi:hypothetical protein
MNATIAIELQPSTAGASRPADILTVGTDSHRSRLDAFLSQPAVTATPAVPSKRSIQANDGTEVRICRTMFCMSRSFYDVMLSPLDDSDEVIMAAS